MDNAYTDKRIPRFVLRWWITMALVVGITLLDWLIVKKTPMFSSLFRFLIFLSIALSLEFFLKTATLRFRIDNIKNSMKVLLKIILIGALVSLVITGIGIAVARWGGVRFKLQPKNVLVPSQYWRWFIHAVIWAPLIEEVVYRGIIQARLRDTLGIWPAIFISGFLFWVYHWVSFGRVTSPHHFAAGLLMAWSFEKTRSLVAPIFLHALGNFILGTSDLLYITHTQWIHDLLGYV